MAQAESGPASQIAIVIPAYNAEPYLADTLRAVSDQTLTSWRCVVVDDGSADSTTEIAGGFAAADERFEVVTQTNQGVACARNHGARISTGEFIMFLDADDMITNDALEHLLDLLRRNPDAPAGHGQAAVIDEFGQPSDSEGYEQRYGRLRIRQSSMFGRLEPVPDTDSTGLETLGFRNPITTPGQVLIRRRALDETGGFDSTVEPTEDWDFWVRLAHHGPFAFVPRDVIRYRKHDAGASAALSRMRSSELKVRRRLITSAHRSAGQQHANGMSGRRIERLARRGLRRTELQRSRERLVLAFRGAVDLDLGSSMRDLARAGSSVLEVTRSFLPARLSETAPPEADEARSVLLVSTASNIGGMERVVCGLALHLPAGGYVVRTVIPKSDRSDLLIAWCADQGVDAESEPAVLDAAASHSPRAAFGFRTFIRQADPAIVNLHYGDNFLSLWDVLAARLSGRHRRVVVSIHHPTAWATENRRKRVMTMIGGRLVHHVTTFSAATEEILRETPLPATRIRRIPCGIAVPENVRSRTEAREMLGVSGDALVIGCIARLVDYKRVDHLIEAVDSPDLAGSILLIGGDGPHREALQKRAATAQHADVRLLGRVDDVNDLLAACDVFSLPSELEGFGLVYLEAAVHGVPSVATRVGGVPDAVVDGETGILVDVGDVAGLRAALVRLADDEPLRRRLGEAARSRVRVELSDTTMASRFADLFDGMS